jgi:hypothetical protein
MAKIFFQDGSEEERKSDKNKNTIAMGSKFFGVPKEVREANKRLSGKGPFDVNDSKTVIDYYKKAKKNKGGGGNL